MTKKRGQKSRAGVVSRMVEIDTTVARLRKLFKKYKQLYSHTEMSFQISDPILRDNDYIRFRVKLLRSDRKDSGFLGFVLVDSSHVLWVRFCYHRRPCDDICRTPLPPDNETEINCIPAKVAEQYMSLSRDISNIDINSNN